MLSNADALSTALRRSAHHFDERIGKAVKKLCPEPETLTAEQSEALVKEHLNVIQRAYYGTTFVAAIVNVTIRCMWTVCIGDSTVGASLHDALSHSALIFRYPRHLDSIYR